MTWLISLLQRKLCQSLTSVSPKIVNKESVSLGKFKMGSYHHEKIGVWNQAPMEAINFFHA